MGNPMLDMLSQSPQQQQPNQFGRLFKMANNMMNPMSALTRMFSQSQIGQVQSLIQKYNGDAQQAFYDLAKQKGVNPNDILNMLK